MKKYILLAVLPLMAISSPLQIKGYQYQSLISDLVNEKKISTEDIKKILNSKEKSVTKVLLTAVDLDFNKKMPEQAGPLYIEIFNKAGTQIKNTTEALYVADYLYRIGNHEDIKVILDEVGCEIFMDKDKTKQCFTYLGKDQ